MARGVQKSVKTSSIILFFLFFPFPPIFAPKSPTGSIAFPYLLQAFVNVKHICELEVYLQLSFGVKTSLHLKLPLKYDNKGTTHIVLLSCSQWHELGLGDTKGACQ